MVKRLNWARIALLVVGLVAVPASLIAVDALSDDAAVTNRNYVLIGIAVQALLVLVAIVLMYRPEANVWFRTKPRRSANPPECGLITLAAMRTASANDAGEDALAAPSDDPAGGRGHPVGLRALRTLTPAPQRIGGRLPHVRG